MSEDEYISFFEKLLNGYGSSMGRPSGFDSTENVHYFSCIKPPIRVPLAGKLTDNQRSIIVERAQKQYNNA